jgi:hypothetical protein
MKISNRELVSSFSIASAKADELLNLHWFLVLEKALKLVRFLLIQMIEASNVYGVEIDHCFVTYEDLAKLVDVPIATVKYWLSSRYINKNLLSCWIQHEVVRGHRVAGIVLRIPIEGASFNLRIPGLKPRIETLKMPKYDLGVVKVSENTYILNMSSLVKSNRFEPL